jgi:hypothetical protein
MGRPLLISRRLGKVGSRDRERLHGSALGLHFALEVIQRRIPHGNFQVIAESASLALDTDKAVLEHPQQKIM